MKTLKTKIGKTDVLVETIETNDITPVTSGVSYSRSFQENIAPFCSHTSAENMKDVFEKANEVIKGMAQELSDSFSKDISQPSEIKVSFGMSLSAEGNIWVIKGGSEVTMNVELTWKQE